MTRIVVIGGGAAGTGAATMALQHDRSARVTLITEFEDIAYSPCGIPYVFAREIDKFDGLFLQPLSYYREMGLDLHTSTVVTGIDLARRAVQAGDASFPFDKLVTKYPFAQINQAVEDQAAGRVIKPVFTFPL